MYKDNISKNGNFNEVSLLKKENDFLKLENNKLKAELDKSKKLIGYTKLKVDILVKELHK